LLVPLSGQPQAQAQAFSAGNEKGRGTFRAAEPGRGFLLDAHDGWAQQGT